MFQRFMVRKRAPHRFRGLSALDVLLRPDRSNHADYHDGWSEVRPRETARPGRETIIVTEQDEQSLRRLVQESKPYIAPNALAQLETELNRALLVDEQDVPHDVVTMNSRVLYEDQDSGHRAETRLVHRGPVVPGESHVSVLAPVGAALLGLSVGQTITWPYAGRDALRLRVAALLYQPEAAGGRPA